MTERPFQKEPTTVPSLPENGPRMPWLYFDMVVCVCLLVNYDVDCNLLVACWVARVPCGRPWDYWVVVLEYCCGECCLGVCCVDVVGLF